MKVKSILVSQPKPQAENSPYYEIEKRNKIKIDFRPFIQVVGIDAKEVRQQKIDFSKVTAVIFTSRNAIDHFFRLAEEMRFTVPDSMKYFCESEAIAFYLQKYIVYRKRKIYIGEKVFADMVPLFKKHKDENFLLPASDVLKPNVPTLLDSLGFSVGSIAAMQVAGGAIGKIANIFGNLSKAEQFAKTASAVKTLASGLFFL